MIILPPTTATSSYVINATTTLTGKDTSTSTVVQFGGSDPLNVPLTISPVAIASNPRDLSVGARGLDVTVLQQFLINENSGLSAAALAQSGGPTGYFGIMTKAAVAEYQRKHGVVPASGYVGRITRAYLWSLN